MEQGTDLFRAMELAHYSERFRNALFIIGLPSQQKFADMLLDLKVLTGYHIRCLLVLPDPDHGLEDQIRRSNKRGTRFHLSLATDLVAGPEDGDTALDFDRLEAKLGQGVTPVIAFHPGQHNPDAIHPVFSLARNVALKLKAKKLFLAGAPMDDLKKLVTRSHILGEELLALAKHQSTPLPVETSAWLDFVAAALDDGVPDIILFSGQPGEIYKETFTHDGAGLLFNNIHSEIIRPATVQDITDIALLLRPDISAGRILPVNENQIEQNIQAYWVYEINGLLAGLARLRDFGTWAELSQFSTLPRYRGKGKARELALRLESEALRLGYTHVFALSIDHRMWEFFKGLGFQESSRETLPDQWKSGYDMNRPSRAFVKSLQDQS